MYSELEFPLDDQQFQALQVECQRQEIQIQDLVPRIVNAYLETRTDTPGAPTPERSA